MTACRERDIFRELNPSSSSSELIERFLKLILGIDERAFVPFSPSDIYVLINDIGDMSTLEMYAIAKRIDGAASIYMISSFPTQKHAVVPSAPSSPLHA
jgi:hypothetical protein